MEHSSTRMLPSSPSIGTVIIAFGAFMIAASIVWSLVPRRDHFVPPGTQITASTQPRLFAEIEKAFGRSLPLATFDRALANAARAESVQLIAGR